MVFIKVLVTGGSGIVGHYVIDELYRSGSHEIVNADLVRMGDMSHGGTIGASQATGVALREGWHALPICFEVGVSDYGQVISAMDGSNR